MWNRYFALAHSELAPLFGKCQGGGRAHILLLLCPYAALVGLVEHNSLTIFFLFSNLLHESRQNRTPHNTRVPRYTRGPMLGTSWNQQRSGHRHPQSAPKHLKALRAEGWQQSRKSSTLVMQSKPVPRHMSRQGQGGAHALPPSKQLRRTARCKGTCNT